MEYRYILQPYKGPGTRFTCPECGKPRTFTRYIDTATGEHLADNVGKCNRENNCGYHYKPGQYFSDTGNKPAATPLNYTPVRIAPELPKMAIPYEVFKASLSRPDENNFISYLKKTFGETIARELTARYFIGTSKNGATVFYTVDRAGTAWAGKVIQYNPETGKRIKGTTTWVHSLLKIENFNINKKLFGEHLLKDSLGKTVAVVESEKTAIIASVYFPELLWLATGSKGNTQPERFTALLERNVVMFPDLNAAAEWKKKAQQLQRICNVTVSDFLESIATEEERRGNLDLADYLLRFSPDEFISNKIQSDNTTEPTNSLDYSDTVYRVLQALKPDEPKSILSLQGNACLPNAETLPRFISVVKDFIDRDEGRHTGNFYAEFNNDYTKIRKQLYR